MMLLSKRFRAPCVLTGLALAAVACKTEDVTSRAVAMGASAHPSARQPDLGKLVTQPTAPPPISGGTLALSTKQQLAVASDPDRDRVYVVDLALLALRYTVQLPPKSEPGRVSLDEWGNAFVALRGSGDLATIDLVTGQLTLRPACIAPRGVAYDRWRGNVLVACASGNIVSLPRIGGAAEPFADGFHDKTDLRDIIVRENDITVTSFRGAKVAVLAPDGTRSDNNAPSLAGMNLAWRATSQDSDDLDPHDVFVTQDPTPAQVSTGSGGYGNSADSFERSSNCSETVGIVSTRLFVDRVNCTSVLDEDCEDSVRLPSAVLPVDVATNGHQIVVVAAGNAFTKDLPQLFIVANEDIVGLGHSECVATTGGNVSGQAIAAGFDSHDQLIVQTREPARLHIMTDDRLRTFKTIDLSPDSRADTGHEIFHANAGGNIACASCHAEGGEDAHTWDFQDIGPRRTPSLLGTTNHTAPYHWSGDMKDISTLMDHVFVERMSGPKLEQPQVDALASYLFALPAPPKLRKAEDVPENGKRLFAQRCASCHKGDMLTNNQSYDIGTGGFFQVPSLVGVAWRAPFLHTGCADTLVDRFTRDCGGYNHSDMQDLDANGVADMVKYMESL